MNNSIVKCFSSTVWTLLCACFYYLDVINKTFTNYIIHYFNVHILLIQMLKTEFQTLTISTLHFINSISHLKSSASSAHWAAQIAPSCSALFCRPHITVTSEWMKHRPAAVSWYINSSVMGSYRWSRAHSNSATKDF